MPSNSAALMKFPALTENNNNFTTNISIEGDEPWAIGPAAMASNVLALAQIIMRMLTVATACAGIISCYVILRATKEVSSNSLKSKPFIINSVIGDIILDVARAVPVIRNMANALGPGEVSKMISVVGLISAALAQYGQAFVSIPLAMDRIYAVIKPMTYYTSGYSRSAKFLLVASSWFVTFALVLPTFIIPFAGDNSIRDKPLYLQLDFGFKQFTEPYRLQILIGVNIFVFLMYMVIFALFIIQRRTNRAVETSSSEKAALSLTLTYFFIHLSTLCLYLPAPIVTIIKDSIPPSVMSAGTWVIVSRALINLYILNTVINPIILGRRVPVIRANIKQWLRINIRSWTREKHNCQISKAKF